MKEEAGNKFEAEALSKIRSASAITEGALFNLHGQLSHITQSNFDFRNKEAIKSILLMALQNPSAIENLASAFSNTLTQISEGSHITKSALDEVPSEIEFELYARERLANWEKKNAYKVWMHRTIRWAAGAVFVVLMYSSFVWLQSKWDFIKIPVRDWAVNSQPQP